MGQGRVWRGTGPGMAWGRARGGVFLTQRATHHVAQRQQAGDHLLHVLALVQVGWLEGGEARHALGLRVRVSGLLR